MYSRRNRGGNQGDFGARERKRNSGWSKNSKIFSLRSWSAPLFERLKNKYQLLRLFATFKGVLVFRIQGFSTEGAKFAFHYILGNVEMAPRDFPTQQFSPLGASPRNVELPEPFPHSYGAYEEPRTTIALSSRHPAQRGSALPLAIVS
jgi:hypothetical protein